MGKARKTRKVSVKRMVKKDDDRIKKNLNQNKKEEDIELIKSVPQVSSAMFFQFNQSIKPPYQIIIDTNFFNFSIQKKIDIVRGMMDCLLAKCIPMHGH